MYAVRTDRDIENMARRINRAIRRKEPLTLTYVKDTGELVIRTVEPWVVVESATGNYYMRTMDRKRNDVRSYRLDRIIMYSVHRTKRALPNKYDVEAVNA